MNCRSSIALTSQFMSVSVAVLADLGAIQYADLLVLDRDYLTVSEDEIRTSSR